MVSEHQAISHSQTYTEQLPITWLPLVANSFDLEGPTCSEEAEGSSEIQIIVTSSWSAEAHTENASCGGQNVTTKFEISSFLIRPGEIYIHTQTKLSYTKYYHVYKVRTKTK